MANNKRLSYFMKSSFCIRKHLQRQQNTYLQELFLPTTHFNGLFQHFLTPNDSLSLCQLPGQRGVLHKHPVIGHKGSTINVSLSYRAQRFQSSKQPREETSFVLNKLIMILRGKGRWTQVLSISWCLMFWTDIQLSQWLWAESGRAIKK